jgi:riboflavin synthase
MFTGIIEAVAPILSIRKGNNAWLARISRPESFDDLAVGASVACNGICLTVVDHTSAEFSVELMAETLAKSNARHWRSETRINLERALQIGGRLDGHWVQGHVDRASRLLERKDEHGSSYLRFALDRDDSRLVVPQGSIAINGVSLTIARLDTASFSVALISHTLQNSNLGIIKTGEEVNLEYDIIGKYLARQKDNPEITMEWLHEKGF